MASTGDSRSVGDEMDDRRYPFDFFDHVRCRWVESGERATKAQLARDFELYRITGEANGP